MDIIIRIVQVSIHLHDRQFVKKRYETNLYLMDQYFLSLGEKLLSMVVCVGWGWGRVWGLKTW